MTKSEILQKARKEAESQSAELRRPLVKLMTKFCSGRVASQIKIEESIDEYDGKILGTEILENISVIEKYNALCGLSVVRSTFISEENPEDISSEDCIKITLYWNDNSDHLTYVADYYPHKENKDVIEQVKALMEAADLIMKKTWYK